MILEQQCVSDGVCSSGMCIGFPNGWLGFNSGSPRC